MKLIIFGADIFIDLIMFGIFYFFWLKFRHEPALVSYLITFMFASLGVKSLMSIFSIRSFNKSIWTYNPFSNLYLVGAVFSALTLLVLGVHWGPLQTILSTVDLDVKGWLGVFGVGAFSVLMIEIVKLKFITQVTSKGR